MMSRLAVTLGLTVLAAVAVAQAQEAEQQKLLARRAAVADAYRQLAEAVNGLQINSQTTVRDFVTESDDIRSDIDTMIRGIRIGEAKYFDDGSCEVPAEVTVQKVIETLRESHQRHYHGDHVHATDFESMAQRIERKVIKVVGNGAPRPDLPPGLPEGVVEILPPAPAPSGPPPVPPLWRNVPAQARLMAKRAATLDAMRQLAERIKGLRLTAHTTVRDFVTESDVITTDLLSSLVGAQEVQVYFHDNELICEVTMRVPTEQVITAIKELHSRRYEGDDVRGTDIEHITRTVVKRDFEATGMGVPPARLLRGGPERAVVMPDWTGEMIKAQGQGTDPAINTPQGALKAARAAEMDAKRRLAEQIAGLRLTSQTVVRDFTNQHDEIVSMVDALITDAQVLKTEFKGDTATVTVGVPGARIWEVVSGRMPRPAAVQPAPDRPAPPPDEPGLGD